VDIACEAFLNIETKRINEVSMSNTEIEILAARFQELKETKKALEAEYREIADRLAAAGPGQYGSMVVLINRCQFDTFDLKRAKVELPQNQLDLIRDFIKSSERVTIQVQKI
jgi:hypothetical protein